MATLWSGIPCLSGWLTKVRFPSYCRGVKPIKIQNENGETIEIKFNADGVIQIRHSDIDPKKWAVLHEYTKRMAQPKMKAALEAKGIGAESKEMLAQMGGYIVLNGDTQIVNAEEVASIHAAVKKAGGILPNWSSQA